MTKLLDELDALRAKASKGIEYEEGYGLEGVSRGFTCDCQFDSQDARWLAAIHHAYPQLRDALRDQAEELAERDRTYLAVQAAWDVERDILERRLADMGKVVEAALLLAAIERVTQNVAFERGVAVPELHQNRLMAFEAALATLTEKEAPNADR
jgi:hypothetical protein